MRGAPILCEAFTRPTQILALVLTVMLVVHSGAARFNGRHLLQEEEDDSDCLKGLLDSARHDQLQNSTLVTWTPTALGSPCNYTHILTAITCNNSRVVSILLPSSNLAGTIPSSLSSCSYLHTLDLSSNSLSGQLPGPLLSSLSFLSVLSLSNNNLSGSIPYELATLGSLTSLDLSRNQVSGSIPPQLGLLSYLQFFNVSNNKLSGRIPSTLSNTSTGSPRFNASCFANNPELYGYPLSPNPPLRSYVPPVSYKKRFPTRFIVCIGLTSGFGSLSLTICIACIWVMWRDVQPALAPDRTRTQRRTQERDDNEQYIGWAEVLERLNRPVPTSSFFSFSCGLCKTR